MNKKQHKVIICQRNDIQVIHLELILISIWHWWCIIPFQDHWSNFNFVGVWKKIERCVKCR